MICPNCHLPAQAPALFCDHCGTPLEKSPVLPPAGTTCPTCYETTQPHQIFCDNCGSPLATTSPAPSRACPACQTPAAPDSTFCDHCGSPLETPPHPPATTIEPPPPAELPTAVSQPAPPTSSETTVFQPRLHIIATHKDLPFPAGKQQYTVGRDDPISNHFPDFDLTPHSGEQGGVSRRHAHISHDGQQFLLKDLNAINFTFINRRKIAPYVPHPLEDGDELRFGRVVVTFHLY